jgi:hypothetical protein
MQIDSIFDIVSRRDRAVDLCAISGAYLLSAYALYGLLCCWLLAAGVCAACCWLQSIACYLF